MIRTIGDKVLIRLDPAPEQVGAIIIPDQFRENPMTGTLIEAGERAKEYLVKRTGDDCLGRRVACPKFQGLQIDVDRVPHLILKAEEVLGLV